MLPEEALLITSLQEQILANTAKGLPPHHGLDKDKLKKAVDLCRKDYTAAQSKSKASGVSNPSGGSAAAIDLAALFTNTASKAK